MRAPIPPAARAEVLRPGHKFAKRHTNSVHGASHSRLALEDASAIDAERAADVRGFEQGLFDGGFWAAPEAVPEAASARPPVPALSPPHPPTGTHHQIL